MTTETKQNIKHLSAFNGIDIPDYGDILNCMHCGMCLPHCPTYALTPLEKANPRGRIALIKAVADGELEITDGFVEAMSYCLNCRACETACPAGVKYGELQEAARAQIQIFNQEKHQQNHFQKFMLGTVFTSNALLKMMGYSLWLYEKSGLQWLTRSMKILNLFAPHLAKLEELSPKVKLPFSDSTIPEKWTPPGTIKYKVGLITGCIMNMTFPDVNRDTAEVLYRNHCEIYAPKTQVCCGSLHGHNGDLDTARILAKRNIDVFEKAGVDYIIINSAGCGSFLKQYGHLLRDDKDYAERAHRFDNQVKDISEFLVMIDFEKPTKPMNAKVTYHEACHLLHGQKISSQPRQILKAIPGLDIVELTESDWCCGSAGIYNIVRYDDSMKLLNRKMTHIKNTQAQYIVTGNPGCIVQINHGIHQQNLPMKTIHPVSLLNIAYKGILPN